MYQDNQNQQPYKPIGEIKFDEFSPPQHTRQIKGKNPHLPRSAVHQKELRAEYNRLQRRMKQIESILGKHQNPNPVPMHSGAKPVQPNSKPIRYGNDFRKYAFDKNDKSNKHLREDKPEPIPPVDNVEVSETL